LLEALQFGVACFFAIFPIVDPFSAAAMLITLTPGDAPARRNEQVRRAVVFMTAIMLVSYFAGTYVLGFFAISRAAVVLAAGILVIRSGWTTLTGAERLTPAQREEGVHKVDISYTPLGMPLLAGPGTISVLIGLSADARGVARHVAAVAAVLAVAVISWAVLRAAPAVTARLGISGEGALAKVMGLIILCVGIQFVINGLAIVAPTLIASPPQ